MASSLFLGYLTQFHSAPLHNGTTICATSYLSTSEPIRDTRVYLPNGSVYNPSLRADGSYFGIQPSPGEVTQTNLYQAVSKSSLDALIMQIENLHGGFGTLTAVTINGDSRTCTAQLYNADFSATSVGIVENSFSAIVTLTFLQFTVWIG